MAGRPTRRFTFNLNDLSETIDNVRNICENDNTKMLVIDLCNMMQNEFIEKKSVETQSDNDQQDSFTQTLRNETKDFECQASPNSDTITNSPNSDNILDMISKLDPDDWEYIVQNTFVNIEYKAANLWNMLEQMEIDDQIQFYSLLGHSLNNYLYNTSKEKSAAKDVTIPDLIKVTKAEEFEGLDERLKILFKTMTEKTREKHGKQGKDNTAQLYNCLESLLKARNHNFVSLPGLKEHLVCYISSNKSRNNSDILSHIGAHGNINMLDRILGNSHIKCKFEDPKHYSLYVSFDNIQQLQKSHRLTGQEQQKIYGIIVTSILGILPDGDKIDKIQYQARNSLSNWFTDLKLDETNQIVYNKLDFDCLKDIASISEANEKIIDDFFIQDLKNELDIVKKETQINGDIIDSKIREETCKKIRMCTEGHKNTNVRSNRKKCAVSKCKAYLTEENINEESFFTFDDSDTEDIGVESSYTENNEEEESNSNNKQNEREIFYMKVENINSETPKHLGMGAIPVNPNSETRIRFVLDHILKETKMHNTYSVQFTVENDEIKKKLIESDNHRSWIFLTVDGLPAKHIIKIIENTYSCTTCGKRLYHPSEIMEHKENHKHDNFCQTYGSFILNIGQFHYCMTMHRSYTKLLWNVDFSDLASSMKLDSAAAQLMIKNGVDFRKSFDFLRSVRKAKLRELLYPFVIFCYKNKVFISVENFLRWVKDEVKSQTYLSILQIERYFGTSLLLYISSYKANNYKMMKIAKQCFSSLFHINNNPNYKLLDVWSDYLDRKMEKENPTLHSYIEKRKFSNKTGEPYRSSPLDEIHEMYNRYQCHIVRRNTLIIFLINNVSNMYFGVIQPLTSCIPPYFMALMGMECVSRKILLKSNFQKVLDLSMFILSLKTV